MSDKNSSDDDEFFDPYEEQSDIDALRAKKIKSNQQKLNQQKLPNHVTPQQPKISHTPNAQTNAQKNETIKEKIIIQNQQQQIPIANQNIKNGNNNNYSIKVSGSQEGSNQNLQTILDKLEAENSTIIKGNSLALPKSVQKGSQSSCSDSKIDESDNSFKPSEMDNSSCSDLSSKSANAKSKADDSQEESKSSISLGTSSQYNGRRTVSFSSSHNPHQDISRSTIQETHTTNRDNLKRRNFDDLKFMRENVKIHEKESSDFSNLVCLQILTNPDSQLPADKKKQKSGNPTWVAKFSPNNKYLAAGGSSGVLKIYKVSVNNNTDDLDQQDFDSKLQILDPQYDDYIKHQFDIIDISWYKDSTKLLTASIDKKVILWSLKKQTFLKVFDHSDIVSCVSFHPLVDEFFVSGCFDKIARVWDINENKVVDWVQLNDYITALTFSPDKQHLLIGNTKGIVKIYKADQGKLKFYLEITCKNSRTWGRLNKQGRKVTEIQFIEDDEFLVVTNDSRMRLINFNDFQTKVKYKGHKSGKLHIQTSFNYEKQMILSGSEDGKVYVWTKHTDFVPQINPLYTRRKKNRNLSYEYFKPFPNVNTPCAIWVPFEIVKTFKEKIAGIWKNIYIDTVMILFSFDSDIKVVGNLIELEA